MREKRLTEVQKCSTPTAPFLVLAERNVIYQGIVRAQHYGGIARKLKREFVREKLCKTEEKVRMKEGRSIHAAALPSVRWEWKSKSSLIT